MSQPAISQATELVTSQNQRLFSRYAAAFKTTDQYITHAKKLADWLRDSKAYYDAARPEIVKLLLIALRTLQNTLGVDPSAQFYAPDYSDNPMVQAYANLVASVEPFIHIFNPEPGSLDYIAHVQGIINTIHRPYAPLIVPSQTQADNPPIPPNTVGRASNQAINSSQSSNLLAKDDPDIMIIERPPDKNFPDNNPAQSTSTATGNKPAVSAGRPKIKKRKTIDFNVLVNYDLKGLQEKKGVQSSSDIDASKTRAIATERKPSTSETPLINPTLATLKEQDSKADIVPSSSRLSTTKGESPTQTLPMKEETPIATSDTSAAPKSLIETPSYLQQTTDIKPSTPENHQQAMEVDQASHPVYSEETTRDVSMAEALPEGIPPNDRQDLNLSRPESLLESKSVDPIARVESTESTHTIENPAPSLTKPTEPEPSMDVDIPNTSNSQLSNETSEMFSPNRSTSEPSSQAVNEASPPQNRSETKLEEHSPPLPDPPKTGKFGPEMRIVTKQEGLPGNGRISIRFHIPEDQHVMVSNWVNYQSTPQSIPGRCVSITLGCYLNADLSESAKAADCTTFEAQVSLASSTWPHEGLAMRASFAEKLEILPLSPPLQVTPENLVDVCPFIAVGHNTILLDQHQDLSQYTFVLHAHYPTRAQLMQVKQKRQKEKEWQEWVQAVTKPLPFHFTPDNQTALTSPVS